MIQGVNAAEAHRLAVLAWQSQVSRGGGKPPQPATPSVFGNGAWDDAAAWNDMQTWKDAA